VIAHVFRRRFQNALAVQLLAEPNEEVLTKSPVYYQSA